MRTPLLCFLTLVISSMSFPSSSLMGQTREEKVRGDKKRVEAEGFWIYNDLEQGYAEARRTGKPLLVNLRCLPCEECVKLDDELVERDPVVRPLLEKFVCVRIVGTNGLDLSLFQYDTDQSFAVFMLNADKTIYGRFGTRSHQTEWVGDVSIEGMARALEGALALHADYPANKLKLAGKRGPKPTFASPELYPLLKDKYTSVINYQGDVVKSCIHCHQIGDAERDYRRTLNQPFPETLIFPYPHPKSMGLILDPREKATLKEVPPDSLAARNGFQVGDRIESLNSQPLISMADVQWVLHGIDPAGGKLTADIRRNGKPIQIEMTLPTGWRRSDDISWRVSSWGYRRMTLGGMKLLPLSSEERSAANIDAEAMALRAEHVGQYGPHAAAKNAGFQKGDILVAYDGQTNFTSESELFFYSLTHCKAGTKVPVSILRNGKRQTISLPMQR